MSVIHAVWRPGSPPRLHVWCETDPLFSFAARRVKSQAHRAPPHPYGAGHGVLPDLLKPAFPDSDLSDCVFDALTLLLPSRDNGPVPSAENPEADSAASDVCAPWRVETLSFAPRQAARFLLGLEPSSLNISYGTDLRAWREVLAAVLELVRHGHFNAGAERDPAGRLTGAWKTVIPDEAEALTRALEEAVPHSGFLLPAGMTRSSALHDFMAAMLDAFVRTGAQDLFQGLYASVEEEWLKSLASPDPGRPVNGPDEEIRQFEDRLGGWSAGGGSEGLRLCLRLAEPEETNGLWRLEFLLQDREDKSLLVPAADVWARDTAAVRVLRRRTGDPRGVLVAQLGRAALVYPSLAQALAGREPASLNLSGRQAYDFLREAALLLRARGFGVLVPAWWHEKKKRFTAVLRVEPGGGEGRGINTLLSYRWEILAGDEKIPLEEFESLVRMKIPLVRIRGEWVELRVQEIENALAYIQKKKSGAGGKISMADALRLALAGETSELGIPVSGIGADGWPGRFLAMSEAGEALEPAVIPPGFRGELRPYQHRGVSWLAFLKKWGFGACLADDMGLGKTVQLIALLACDKAESPEGRKPWLLICPTSIVTNWQREFARFCPEARVLVHQGAARLDRDAFLPETEKADIVLTSYSLVSRDRELLASRSWGMLILDEAQNIKNDEAQQTAAVKSLEAEGRIALTGTPVENRLSELWSIMDFLNKGYLGPLSAFRDRYQNPIEKRGHAEKVESLQKIIAPFVLRRLKTDRTIIRDLPEKMEMKVFCNLTREQASLYKAVVDEMLAKIAAAEGIRRKGLVLSALVQLKQVCNHPAQYLKDKSALGERSGKLNRLVEMLEESTAEGDKALVFTQFAEMGELLAEHLGPAFGSNALFFHGGLSPAERDAVVRSFQEKKDVPVLIVSTKAGGTGLNLTAASRVFHFDRWWNPAVENQATDRAYRIGQTRRVQIHKFVCAGTVEERIDAMIERKAELAETVLSSGEDFLTEMSTDELRDMLWLSRDAAAE